MSRELQLDGPVTLIESDTDPGDMGEPRRFSEDGMEFVVVPAARLWPHGLAAYDEPSEAANDRTPRLEEALRWALRNDGGECPADHPEQYAKALRLLGEPEPLWLKTPQTYFGRRRNRR